MQRRLALAVALAFTTLVTFGVMVFGAQNGIFSDKKAAAQDAVAEPPPDTPEAASAAAAPPAPAPAQLEPLVQTRYVYVDDPAPAGPPPASVASTPAASPTATPTRSASATALPAATATAIPPTAAPSSTPPATATAAPQSVQASEIEFVGTVTAISGNMVTFSHGGTQTDVQVKDPSSLSIGAQTHVHAILKSGVYVATEIEVV